MLLRILQGIFDFEPDLGLKLGPNKPTISVTVPANRTTTIQTDSGPISACFDDDPKLLNCEIAQPSWVTGGVINRLSRLVTLLAISYGRLATHSVTT